MAAPLTLQVKGALIQVWQGVSKASQFLEQGKRLENLSWRLWSLQALGDDSDDIAVLNRGRVAGHILNRDKGAPALLPASGQPKAKCCKIDPSVPCVHKKSRGASRGALAAGPSVPLRATGYISVDSGNNTPTEPIASSSRTTLDAYPSASGFAQPPPQKPSQSLWPISNVSPHAHLAPSPFFSMGNGSSNNSNNAGPSAISGPQGVPSAAQMMLSALIDSLLSAGVAPAVAAQAVQNNPTGLMATLGYQPSFENFGMGSTSSTSHPPIGTGTLPSTPMDWSAGASGPLPANFDELARSSLADFFAGQQGEGAGQSLGGGGGGSFGLSDASALQQGMNLSMQPQSQPQQQSEWFNLAQGGSSSSPSASRPILDPPTDLSHVTGQTTYSAALRRSEPNLVTERRVNDLRQEAQMSMSTSDSPGTTMSPAMPEQSGSLVAAPFVADSAERRTFSSSKTNRKRASLDMGATGPAASSAKGKGKATAVQLQPDASSSKSKDSPGSKRGPLQTTNSSTRKAASTVASPAAPPDQAPPQCSNCGVKKTPLWRRCGEQHELLCNACGLYWAMHKTHRPEKLKHHRSGRNVGGEGDDDGFGGTGSGGGAGAGGGAISEDDGPETLCSNCGTSTTPLWRKDREGNTVCNACGLFMKLHGNARPVKMRADVIKKRVRYDNPLSPTGSGMSPLGAGAGQPGMLLGSPGGGLGPASGLGAGSGSGQGGAGVGHESMDLDVALANLHSSGPVLDTPPLSAQNLLSGFPSGMPHERTGSANSAAAATFAAFHPGSDTLGRLTTTGGAAPPGTSTSTPLSQTQAHTPTAFAQQHQHQHDAMSVQQRQRHEQEQWAQAAGFLLPHEPMGDGFNAFGQALWGCDPGVIGNWHASTSPNGGQAPVDGNVSAVGVGGAEEALNGGGQLAGGGIGGLNGHNMDSASPRTSTNFRIPGATMGRSGSGSIGGAQQQQQQQHASSAMSSPAIERGAATAARTSLPHLFDLATGGGSSSSGGGVSGTDFSRLHMSSPGVAVNSGGGSAEASRMQLYPTTSAAAPTASSSLLHTPSSMGGMESPQV
ncbi:unnamed protein product [Tilletia controversa]|uniref:Uncharacterized protein n=2 Tax=Tilletia TaxID=13289 RepID=A0A9N8QDC3_9BASI|nr:unnamed protein product [Tilletia caries]CAD6914413.1 unnamed protein product [Tilletia laevis]CAD6926680.1 unnamed protein product [Tilletia controversa]CAD6921335.1 unnamed protein product [Tilletia laevis]CAD6927777.1 unnamed protein product [Tilletia controversa]